MGVLTGNRQRHRLGAEFFQPLGLWPVIVEGGGRGMSGAQPVAIETPAAANVQYVKSVATVTNSGVGGGRGFNGGARFDQNGDQNIQRVEF